MTKPRQFQVFRQDGYLDLYSNFVNDLFVYLLTVILLIMLLIAIYVAMIGIYMGFRNNL